MSVTVEKPLSLVIVYTLALAGIYKGSYRGLTVRLGLQASGAVLILETYQEVATCQR